MHKIGLSAQSLRNLHEIDVHGGVRAAADALSINPSVISRQVAQLEREHGVVLLERRGRSVALTEIAHSLVDHFREVSRRDAEMLTRLADYRGLRRGRVAIGIGEGRMETMLAKVLDQFSVQFPDILIEMHNGKTSEVMAMVRDGVADIGLCTGGVDDPALRSRVFKAPAIHALVSPHHPLADRRKVRFDQLISERLIFMPARFNVQQYIDAFLRDARLVATPAYRCDQFGAALAIAAAGLGVAFMSTDAASLYLETGKLVALEIEPARKRDFTRQLIRRIGGHASPAAEALWKHLIQAMRLRA